MRILYQITTGNACFGAETNEDGIIVTIAPIGKRYLGEYIDRLPYYMKVKQVQKYE